jgi:hypothetical protein
MVNFALNPDIMIITVIAIFTVIVPDFAIVTTIAINCHLDVRFSCKIVTISPLVS